MVKTAINTEEIIEIEEEVRANLLNITDKNIFITAGAGAGKSTLMVGRMIQQARLEHQPFNETVAITFTNKAAMELEEKVMTELLQLSDSPVKERLLAERNSLTIGTIHSFCQKLLQERPIEVGLSPDFSVIEESEAKELFTTIMYDTFYGEFAENHDDYNYILENGVPFRDYVNMLYTLAINYELGLKETELQADDLIATEKNVGNFIESIKEEVYKHEIMTYFGVYYRVINEIRSSVNQNYKFLSLKEHFETLIEEGNNIEDTLNKILLTKSKNQLMKRVRETNKEIDSETEIDNEQWFEALENFIFEKFSEKMSELIREDSLSKEEIFKESNKNWQQELDFYPHWKKKLQELIDADMAEEEKTKQLFEHLFATPGRHHTIRDFFTPTNKKNYDELDQDNYLELSKLLTNLGTFGAKFVNKGKLDFTSYKTARYVYNLVGARIKHILQQLFRMTIERYEAEKLRKNVVTNNDLLRKTYELMQQEEARLYFQRKYKYIYVDEFQDTDPLQTKILFYLTSTTRPSSIEDAQPKAGSLFLVGDPKQSIYRFRNADLSIYEQISEFATESDEWITEELQINFRSDKRLIHWYNQIFPPFFKQEKDPSIQPSCNEMIQFKQYNDHGVYRLSSDGEKEKIATWIMARKEQDETFDYDDVLIIVPGNYHVKDYVEELKKYGIPTSFSGKIKTNEFSEVVKLASLINYLAKPNHFKKQFVLAQNFHISFSLLKEYNATELDARKSSEAFSHIRFAEERLKYYLALSKTLPPLELVHALVYEEQFGIYNPELSAVDYEASRSILTTVIELLRSANPQTYASLAAHLNGLLDEPIEYELLADDSEKAVRIMNLHKTKGLQAKYVFLASEKKEANFPITSIVSRDDWDEKLEVSLHTRLGVGATYYYYTQFFLEQLPYEERHKEAERIRKLYVAATRAEKMLIITDNSKNAWYDLIDESIPYLEIPEYEMVNSEKQYLNIPDISATNESELTETTKYSSYRRVNPSNSLSFKSETVVEEAVTVPDVQVDEAKHYGPLWGSLFHAGIEYALETEDVKYDDKFFLKTMMKGLESYDLTEAELKVLGVESLADVTRHERLLDLANDESLRNYLKASIDGFLEQAFFKELNDSHHFFLEFPFTAWLSGEEAAILDLKNEKNEAHKPIYISGIIDLLFQSKVNEKEIVIVDYKTDKIREAENVDAFHHRLKNAYRAQLRAYRHIMAHILGDEASITTYLYSVHSKTFLQID